MCNRSVCEKAGKGHLNGVHIISCIQTQTHTGRDCRPVSQVLPMLPEEDVLRGMPR